MKTLSISLITTALLVAMLAFELHKTNKHLKSIEKYITYNDSLTNALNSKVNAFEHKRNAQMLYLIKTINDREAIQVLVNALDKDYNNYKK